ncbi:hypothetical protein MASSI9I_50574 [Massilia sp. 9I]|nr:hypothetical protein MASSI9I_50574 [Massilia sp. 9I]
MPQPGQGQHGHDRRARLPARAGTDRAGRRRAPDHGAPGRVAALARRPGQDAAGAAGRHARAARPGRGPGRGRPPSRPGPQALAGPYPRPGLEPVCVRRRRLAADGPSLSCRAAHQHRPRLRSDARNPRPEALMDLNLHYAAPVSYGQRQVLRAAIE